MEYKGYLGKITYDDEAKIFHGEVIGLKDIITFQGKSVNELKKAFQDSINDYLAWYKERGEQPEKDITFVCFAPQFPLRSNRGPHRKKLKMGLNKLNTNG